LEQEKRELTEKYENLKKSSEKSEPVVLVEAPVVLQKPISNSELEALERQKSVLKAEKDRFEMEEGQFNESRKSLTLLKENLSSEKESLENQMNVLNQEKQNFAKNTIQFE